jgi:hypothetical protein
MESTEADVGTALSGFVFVFLFLLLTRAPRPSSTMLSNSTSGCLVFKLPIAFASPLFSSSLNWGSRYQHHSQSPSTSCQPCLALTLHYLDILFIHMAYLQPMSDAP